MFLQKKYLLFFGVIVVAFALYCYNPFDLFFLNDDFIHIPLSRDGVLLQHNSFRPICDISMMIDYQIWGKTAWGWHLTNLLLHIANTILVFILSKKLCSRYKFAAQFPFAFLISLLFFIYAMHSETVFWILGRSAALGCLFILLSLTCFLCRRQVIFFILSVLFAVLAWLSYESTWILPIVFVVISIVDIKQKLSFVKSEVVYSVIPIIFFLLYLIARNYFIHEVIGQYGTDAFLDFHIQTLAINFFKLMLRSWLPASENTALLIIIFSVLIILLFVFYFTAKQKKIRSSFLLLIIFWLLTLVPYASLSVDTKGTESERFLYLPSVLVCLMIIFIAANISSQLLRRVIVSITFFTQIIFLWKNMVSYQFAGAVTRTAMQQIAQVNNKRILFVDSLPQEHHGALIFRVGFPEAVKWFRNDPSFDSIVVLSIQQTDQHFTNNYKAEKITESNILNRSFLKDLQDSSFAYFKFSGSNLQVYDP